MGQGPHAALEAAAGRSPHFVVPLPDARVHADTHTHTHGQLFRLLFGKQRLPLCLWKADSRMDLATGHEKQNLF